MLTIPERLKKTRPLYGLDSQTIWKIIKKELFVFGFDEYLIRDMMHVLRTILLKESKMRKEEPFISSLPLESQNTFQQKMF